MDNVFLILFLSSLRFCDLKSVHPTLEQVTKRPVSNVIPTINTPSTNALPRVLKTSTTAPTSLPTTTTTLPTTPTTEKVTPSLSPKEQERLINQIFPRECGKGRKQLQFTNRRRRKRVVGGQAVAIGQFPWQAALLFNGRHYCGGSIIHQNYIVTGAHCFNPYTSSDPSHWVVRVGDHRLRDIDETEIEVKVENITIHERYISMWFEGITDTPPMNDIAIVKLKEPLIFNTYIKPICVLRPSITFKPRDKCAVSGWGHLQWNGSQPNVMNYADVPIVSHNDCNIEKAYNGTIHRTALCAGYPQGGHDACEYDSGGPLSCKKCGRFYLNGVVSWGHECARPYKYGVYARMQVLTEWMAKKIAQLEGFNDHHFRSG